MHLKLKPGSSLHRSPVAMLGNHHSVEDTTPKASIFQKFLQILTERNHASAEDHVMWISGKEGDSWRK